MASRHSRDSRYSGDSRYSQDSWYDGKAEAALDAAIERFVIDESAVPAPLRLSRTGDSYPAPHRPPTKRGHRDPPAPSGSFPSDGQTGSHGASGDAYLPSTYYVAPASGGIRLDHQRRSGSSRRQVSGASRPPRTPLRTGDTSRPPLTPLRMGRPGPAGSPPSPGPASFPSSGPPSDPPRRRLSRRITSSTASLGLSSWSTPSSADAPATASGRRRGATPPPSPAARALRAGGRRLSQGLESVNRAAQGLLGQRQSSYHGCPRHGLELCHACMFRIVHPGAAYDAAGRVVLGDKVDGHPAVAVPPAYGMDARFRPLYDPQVRAPDPSAAAADALGQVSPLPARYAEPRPAWFAACPRCQLTHLVGVRGPGAAAHHPSHCANAAGERSVAVWVDAEPRYHPRQGAAGRYSVYFGRGSRFNVAGEERGFANAAALEFGALARALRHAGHVLVLRRDLVARRGISNSHAFLWGLTRFRLLVFSPLKALGQWLQTAGPGDAPDQVAHFLNFDRVDGNPRQAWLDSRRLLDDAIAWLAYLGVEVSFFPYRTQGYTPEWRMFA